MPKIPNLLAFGKHSHNCGKWMQRRALRKDVACNFCQDKIFASICNCAVDVWNATTLYSMFSITVKAMASKQIISTFANFSDEYSFYQTKQYLGFLKVAIVTHQSKEKD